MSQHKDEDSKIAVKEDGYTKAKKKATFKRSNKETFELLFVGDTSFGENYQKKMQKRGQSNILEQYGYDYPLAQMKSIMSAADFVVSNLETPITDLKQSPYRNSKDYVHWTDVKKTPTTLREHNVGLVSLANNHTFDYAKPGFKQTLSILDDYQLPYIGAGNTIKEAGEPYVGEIQWGEQRFRFAIIAAFERLPSYQNKYKVYADAKRPGLMPLDIQAITTTVQSLKADDPSLFVIAYPHWGGNYHWRDEIQTELGHQLLANGVDLIIGHGAHMIQEFERIDERWIVYSIGNFMFNSKGRYQKLNAPPYSYVAKLCITPQANGPQLALKLYPIVTDNTLTHYQPRFLTEKEFDQIANIISEKKINNDTHSATLNRDSDRYGFHFTLPLQIPHNNTTKPKKTIGLICRVLRGGGLNDHIFLWMFRAIAIQAELDKHAYQLACYTPADISPSNHTVKAYFLQNNAFVPRFIPIPTLNYDWHVGPVKLGARLGFKYRDYETWATQHGYRIFPTQSFRQLTNDKLASHQCIHAIDPQLSPDTELYDATKMQLKRFLDKHPRVFIKPRFGSMGDNIFVIQCQDHTLVLTHYYDKTVNQASLASLTDCIDSIQKQTTEDYIIQTGIECLQYQNSTFDIRVILLNDSKQWHIIKEARVGVASSDLSNVSQGGHNHSAIDVLSNMMPIHEAKAILTTIDAKATLLAKQLDEQFNGTLIEFAIDFLVDKQHMLKIAELNTKPGLAGMPDLFDNFPILSQHEENTYNTLTLPHGRHLAQFLIAQYEQHNTKPFWFDAITTPLELTNTDCKNIAKALYNACQHRTRLDSQPFAPLTLDKSLRIAFLSITDNQSKSTAVIVRVQGYGIMDLLQQCLEHLRLHALPSLAFKLDIVNQVHTCNNHPLNDPVPFERSLHGIALAKNTGIALLPEQVIVSSAINQQGLLRPAKLDTFTDNAYQLSWLSQQQHYVLYYFTTHSIYCDGTNTHRLYRGHRLFSTITPAVCLEHAILGANYLQACVLANGQFLYEYLPKRNLASPRYNILRHAGSIYAMLEVYELSRKPALLTRAMIALDYLVKQARPINLNNQEMLYIVENDTVKLGANALTLLALCKYMSLTGDTSYLPFAQRCAMWMVATQANNGQFTVHKQIVSTQQTTPFISEYYPGEAIFALTRLYQIDNNATWLKAGTLAADYIINERDKNVSVDTIAHDHWFLYALNELQQLQPSSTYIQHTHKLCQAIIGAQLLDQEPLDYFGGYYMPPRSTPVAIRAEGLCAAYYTLLNAGESELAAKIRQTIDNCLRFELQTQFLAESSMYLPEPSRALGGFHRSLTDYSIRIDYVQHNISALLGYQRVLSEKQPLDTSAKTRVGVREMG